MKQINVYFEDLEMKELVRLKGKDTWHDFIMQLLPKEDGERNELF